MKLSNGSLFQIKKKLCNEQNFCNFTFFPNLLYIFFILYLYLVSDSGYHDHHHLRCADHDMTFPSTDICSSLNDGIKISST